MSKIRILPEQLANQIAAGEVVERPASVVKEMVENSLDAGATRIEVEVEGGGTRLIRIIDNGVGMDEDDLLMSLERHGTSKIQTEEDLGAISTLGFRGEAVPSIGSVSKLTLTSRIKDSDLGTRVVLEYGKLTKVHEIGCSFGTTIEVRSLFGKTPARRKFLRTTRTELGHIEEIIKNYALGCPEITFILRIDGRDTLYFDASQDLSQRLANLMRYDGPFIPLSASSEGPAKTTRVTGYLLPPEKVTVGPARLRIFVNSRAVKDRMVTHAIVEGLRSFLMKGKNPSGLVHLEIPHEEVDVNVHPAKHEVRFRNSQDVHTFISRAVAQAMENHQQVLQTSIFGQTTRSERSAAPIDHGLPVENCPSDVGGQRELPIHSDYHSTEWQGKNPETRTPQALPQQNLNQRPLASPNTTPAWADQKLFEPPSQSLLARLEPIHKKETEENTASTPDFKSTTDTSAAQLAPEKRQQRHNLLIIGQFDDLYIFCRDSEGLLVVDQHAAHERLLYEKLHKQYLEKSVVSQTLMFPETVELSLFQAQLTLNNLEEIKRMGFTVNEFGGNTFVISAVPALAGLSNPRELFLDILEQFGSEQNRGGGGVLDNILANMACKAAVKAGTSLSTREIDNLLNNMAQANLFSHCPHGRPVIKRFSTDDVKKWFYRT
ncbi:DNA mismatch repair endonuclease MutL [Desulforhopalus sp. IMCC35007]|uniref:DNA mismatch repair endonuclease MutL n=1 Tax=Desulforhopalus sp. IMCC35007 TaxID=2569543 RepID=UPI0010AE8DE6|nr:DNA mismatch repair endonuclease MutL [Desulforhopalus sp. IMCC35007]TKB10656.1 DNA mismatch repair endonuclease MutL [Desulforhopalus sp. IMCC35007]